MALRNLVDIERLGRALPSAQLVELSRLRPVRNSWLAHGSSFEMDCAFLRIGSAQSVCIAAEVAQQMPWRSLGDCGWTVANRLRYFAHMVNLSHNPIHVVSTLMSQLMLIDLIDPQTGDLRSIPQVVLRRAEKLRRRLKAQAESPDRPV